MSTYEKTTGEHRLPSEYADKLMLMLDLYYEQLKLEPSGNAQRIALIQAYKQEKNPDKSHNARSNPSNAKAKKITYESIPDLLAATGWPAKFVVECCLEGNLKYSPEECLSRNTAEWQTLTWPNSAMSDFAKSISKKTMKKKAAALNLIYSQMPAVFPLFCEKLLEPSGEYGKRQQTIPAYLKSKADADEAELVYENMGNRIKESLYFKLNDTDSLKRVLKVAGIDYDDQRIVRPRHFWAFKPKDLDKICKSFSLSPHWLFFGTKDIPLLMNNVEDERIVDVFSLLPENIQIVIAEATK